MSVQPGNQKLGPLFTQWSVLAGETCPGRSALCFEMCYARKGRFLSPGVVEAHERNWHDSESPDFTGWMNQEIRRVMAQLFRIHVAGDYYDAPYTEKWLDIVRRNRRTTFLTYTRSWRDPEIYPVLKAMSREDNVHLWFSCDRETGAPPRLNRVRRAYMMVDDNDRPRMKVDLVFRDGRAPGVVKWVGDTLVCPYDNGVTKTTCSRCGLCWRREAIPCRSPSTQKTNTISTSRSRSSDHWEADTASTDRTPTRQPRSKRTRMTTMVGK